MAKHYGLKDIGAIAPGYKANFIILDDVESFNINNVFCNGKIVSEIDFSHSNRPIWNNTVKAILPTESDLEGPKGSVHVIIIRPFDLITDRCVTSYNEKGVARLSVLERYNHNSKPVNGYVFGFGENLKGAIGSSVSHDCHNLIVVGNNTSDMRKAFKTLIDMQGGFCVVKDDFISTLPLPFAGIMTFEDYTKVILKFIELKKAARSIGCILEEPFLQLGFLSLPVIPYLKLTDKGLFDVNESKFISVKAT